MIAKGKNIPGVATDSSSQNTVAILQQKLLAYLHWEGVGDQCLRDRGERRTHFYRGGTRLVLLPGKGQGLSLRTGIRKDGGKKRPYEKKRVTGRKEMGGGFPFRKRGEVRDQQRRRGR